MMKRTMQNVAAGLAATGSASATPPNIILIMVDDMGFSDLGYMGGEIETPHLDQLAHGGVRYTQFYNSGRCCPTRATLMTGLHPHEAGIGWMTQATEWAHLPEEPPPYQGFLNRNCATIAELLQPQGYATFMTGKWHLGWHEQDLWPKQRGFEKFYGILEGASRFFHPEHPRGITSGNERIHQPESTTDEAFYTTDAFTDHGLRFMKEELEGQNRPMFWYLAYNAPHWPLQAFEADIAKYRGRYKKGWDKLREARYQRQIESGLIDPKWPLSPKTPGIPDWDSLDEETKDEMDLKMAVYAAMVDRVDQNIGKLVEFLKAEGLYDNTMIMFLSDNGACQEGGMRGRGEFRDIEKRNQDNANSYGEAWANAGNTPLRLYKHYVHEGGSATPFFIHWPKHITPQADWYLEPGQIHDIMPTILDVAGASYPDTLNGHELLPLDGVSLRPSFSGEAIERSHPIVFEHQHNAAIRKGDWKLVGRDVAKQGRVHPENWELYHMVEDRTEMNDLATVHPDKAQKLADRWNEWADRVNVYPKGERGHLATPEPHAPQVRARAFTVEVVIDSHLPQGVALSHGDAQFGYALFFEEGWPMFAYRNRGELTQVHGNDPVSGRVTISVRVDAGELVLLVNGERMASVPSPGLLAEQPGAGLFIGASGREHIGLYRHISPGPTRWNRFRGKIPGWDVRVDLPHVTLRTPWGEKLDPENVWAEYPRPMLRRDAWSNLNGWWSYAITAANQDSMPEEWEGRILVPFAPEAPLSGVERPVRADQALWYQRSLRVQKQPKRRYLLNFEAVDYHARVWVNGTEIGAHIGGNLPFSFDVTDALKDGENILMVRALDAADQAGAYQLHGKQARYPYGTRYTCVTGIWQTVWLEDVPEIHARDIKIRTVLDGTVKIQLDTGDADPAMPVHVSVSLEGRTVAEAQGTAAETVLRVPDPQIWSPDKPTLYDVELTLGDDTIKSYFGIREVGRLRDPDGHLRLALNGKPIFHWGTLDQGWWPDGLLTPPSEEAMVSDLIFLKNAGFNTVRKHLKVEPRRYYYHCDRMGLLVWQDHVSHRDADDGAHWSRLRENPVESRWPDWAHRQFMEELKGMVDVLGNHPSIVMWVPFNERWGQHRSMAVGEWITAYDPTRHINIASGGNWYPVGHIVDDHRYPHPGFSFEQGVGGRFDDFIKVAGEFGGHALPVPGHLWDPAAANWGYGDTPASAEEWSRRYSESLDRLIELKGKGVAAGIYTQTTDVEAEINGLLTYDRKAQKWPAAELKKLSEKLLG